MLNPTENLRSVLKRFQIGNSELARALGVDPSLVSRWLSGERKLKASSVTMEALAELLMKRCRRMEDFRWLQENFLRSGLPTEMGMAGSAQNSLILWLASDGDDLRRNIGTPSRLQYRSGSAVSADAPQEERVCQSGNLLPLVMELDRLLESLPDGAALDVFLSDDEATAITDGEVVRLLVRAADRGKCNIRLLVRISGNTEAMSGLIHCYLPLLVSAKMRIFTIHGMTQAVVSQTHILLPGQAALLISEIKKGVSAPVGMVVRDGQFLRDMEMSFERILRYAQKALNVYDDNYSRNILELLYQEFAMPGHLDVVKDSINPLFMAGPAYERVLRAQGQGGDELAWRSAEFSRFKQGMDQVLAGGTVFREILPMSRLNRIVECGCCRMPGLYFMEQGCVDLDAQGCADILQGYLLSLENVPAFQMMIMDDVAPLHTDSCWHIKQHRSMAINTWNGEEPVMIHSDQPWLVREFQAHFERLWARQNNVASSRGQVAAILQDALTRLTARHLQRADSTTVTH